MTSFLLFEIRNTLRLEGYEVTKYTNRRVINTLLELKKDSTLSDICERLEMSYIGREGGFIDNESKEIFLHFLDSKTTLCFKSLKETSRELGINLITSLGVSKILEKIIIVDEKRAVLSFNNIIDRNFDFPPCLENKININLALSHKLGYTVEYDISLPEIFSLLDEKIPMRKLKEKLCKLLEIPYYFEKKRSDNKRVEVLAKSQEEVLFFKSLTSAGKFFQTSGTMIRKMIETNYRVPFWYKRYSLEFV